MELAVGVEQQVVKTSLNKTVVVAASDIGVNEWRPCDGQRCHAVFVLELVRDIGAVLASTGRDDDVERAVLGTVLVEQDAQFFLTGLPVDLLFFFGVAAGAADAFFIKADARPLVRCDASFTEEYLLFEFLKLFVNCLKFFSLLHAS